MKPKEIQDLIDFISKSGLNEVNVETNDFKISVKREAEKEIKIMENTGMAPQMMAAPLAIPAAPVVATPSIAVPVSGQTESSESSSSIEIKAPMIGTFYRRANPESPNFVSVGDEVKEGQVICIIEAMKLFNEIEADMSGKIVKILADDTTPVEFDQPLFLIEPA